MLALDPRSVSQLLATTRDEYRARNYPAVVRLLSPVPHTLLIAQPEAGFMLADAARRVGRSAGMLELTSAVVEAARQRGEAAVLCDALNLEGVLLLEAGRANAAERAWCELVDVATQADNPEFVARASNNLGVAAILAMRLEDAITRFQRAVGAYLRLGYARGLAQSHQNLAIIFRELDREAEAYSNFERALSWGYTADCMDDVARAEQELALLLLFSGRDANAAAAMVEQALDRFAELGQPAGCAEAQRVAGVIYLASGRLDDARACLTSALDGARALGLKLLEAETLLALAHLGRPDATDEALRVFGEIGAEPWGRHAQQRLQKVLPAV